LISGLSQRRQHVDMMVRRRTPWAVRRALLDYYGIRYVAYRHKRRKWYRWTRAAGHELGQAGRLHLVRMGPR
jgi:hypothetical protein